MDVFNIVLTNNTLFIKFEGIISYRTILHLREKIEYIFYEYRINEIIIDIDDCLNIDDEPLAKFIDDYSKKGKKQLVVTNEY